ncbi:MAG: hypothetical protein NT076_02945 [Candidatus Pacearchaeota archaeon]|nr:hypothetical protein [Candidatus Pacearchaeota archaeon]
MKKGQISIEYLMIMGFVTFVIVGILSLGVFYSSTITDKIRMNYVGNFANKVITSSESIFYSGKPAKVTIFAYLPDGVKQIEIEENDITFWVASASGENKISFSSSVPISGAINHFKGLKKITISAQQNYAEISTQNE